MKTEKILIYSENSVKIFYEYISWFRDENINQRFTAKTIFASNDNYIQNV